MYYILKGKVPVKSDDMTAWVKCFHGNERIVAQSEVKDVKVSTVFMGIHHSFGGSPPMLFETMVSGGVMHEEQVRTATWDEAVVAHEMMCEDVIAAEAGERKNERKTERERLREVKIRKLREAQLFPIRNIKVRIK